MIFLVVGGTGSGKSTFVKERIKGREKHTFVFDPQNSYIKCHNVETPEELLLLAQQRENCIIVAEEATIYFYGAKGGDLLRNLIISHRHKKQEIYLVYHTLNSIPPIMYAGANFLVLFNTNDKYAPKLPNGVVATIPTQKYKCNIYQLL